MIESTDSFQKALQKVYDDKKARGELTADDRKYTGQIINQPIATDSRGRPFYSMRRLHARVRTMFYLEMRRPWNAPINWDEVIQWIKDHWLQILQAAAAILSILILI